MSDHNREQIFTAIDHERNNQFKKWGRQRHVGPVWFTILGEEIGEVGKAILESDDHNLEVELIQCAAVIVAWLEYIREFQQKGDF